MKKIGLVLACFALFELQAFDYEVQFENDQVCVAQAKVYPFEEIGLHRDEYYHIVLASKGGVITRFEASGEETEVEFPTGVPILRGPDPEDEFHRSSNPSAESVEFIIIHLKKGSPCGQ